MLLDGAKFICIEESGKPAQTIIAKGKNFTIGCLVDCDYVFEQAEKIHCIIECDAFGHVTIFNKSERNPISVNGEVVTIKRTLFNNSKIKILNRDFIWQHAKTSTSVDVTGDTAGMSTPNKQIGIPVQPPNSCPSLKYHRNHTNRFTVHNLKSYRVDSDESNSLNETSETTAAAAETTLDGANSTAAAQALNEATPAKVDLVDSTPNKKTSSTEKRLKTFRNVWGWSGLTTTSYSPREAGVRLEKSFTAIIPPTTPNSSLCRTPKGLLERLGVEKLLNKTTSTDQIIFATPTKQSEHNAKNSQGIVVQHKKCAMKILDLTTPSKLHPESPHPKTLSIKKPSTVKALTSFSDKSSVGIADKRKTLTTPMLSTPKTAADTETPISTSSAITVDSSSTASDLSEVSAVTSTTQSRSPKTTQSITASSILRKQALLASVKKQQQTTASTSAATTPVTTKPKIGAHTIEKKSAAQTFTKKLPPMRKLDIADSSLNKSTKQQNSKIDCDAANMLTTSTPYKAVAVGHDDNKPDSTQLQDDTEFFSALHSSSEDEAEQTEAEATATVTKSQHVTVGGDGGGDELLQEIEEILNTSDELKRQIQATATDDNEQDTDEAATLLATVSPPPASVDLIEPIIPPSSLTGSITSNSDLKKSPKSSLIASVLLKAIDNAEKQKSLSPKEDDEKENKINKSSMTPTVSLARRRISMSTPITVAAPPAVALVAEEINNSTIAATPLTPKRVTKRRPSIDEVPLGNAAHSRTIDHFNTENMGAIVEEEASVNEDLAMSINMTDANQIDRDYITLDASAALTASIAVTESMCLVKDPQQNSTLVAANANTVVMSPLQLLDESFAEPCEEENKIQTQEKTFDDKSLSNTNEHSEISAVPAEITSQTESTNNVEIQILAEAEKEPALQLDESFGEVEYLEDSELMKEIDDHNQAEEQQVTNLTFEIEASKATIENIENGLSKQENSIIELLSDEEDDEAATLQNKSVKAKTTDVVDKANKTAQQFDLSKTTIDEGNPNRTIEICQVDLNTLDISAVLPLSAELKETVDLTLRESLDPLLMETNKTIEDQSILEKTSDQKLRLEKSSKEFKVVEESTSMLSETLKLKQNFAEDNENSTLEESNILDNKKTEDVDEIEVNQSLINKIVEAEVQPTEDNDQQEDPLNIQQIASIENETMEVSQIACEESINKTTAEEIDEVAINLQEHATSEAGTQSPLAAMEVTQIISDEPTKQTDIQVQETTTVANETFISKMEVTQMLLVDEQLENNIKIDADKTVNDLIEPKPKSSNVIEHIIDVEQNETVDKATPELKLNETSEIPLEKETTTQCIEKSSAENNCDVINASLAVESDTSAIECSAIRDLLSKNTQLSAAAVAVAAVETRSGSADLFESDENVQQTVTTEIVASSKDNTIEVLEARKDCSDETLKTTAERAEATNLESNEANADDMPVIVLDDTCEREAETATETPADNKEIPPASNAEEVPVITLDDSIEPNDENEAAVNEKIAELALPSVEVMEAAEINETEDLNMDFVTEKTETSKTEANEASIEDRVESNNVQDKNVPETKDSDNIKETSLFEQVKELVEAEDVMTAYEETEVSIESNMDAEPKESNEIKKINNVEAPKSTETQVKLAVDEDKHLVSQDAEEIKLMEEAVCSTEDKLENSETIVAEQPMQQIVKDIEEPIECEKQEKAMEQAAESNLRKLERKEAAVIEVCEQDNNESESIGQKELQNQTDEDMAEEIQFNEESNEQSAKDEPIEGTKEKDVPEAEVAEDLTKVVKVDEQVQSDKSLVEAIDDDRSVPESKTSKANENLTEAGKVYKQIEPDESMVEVISDDDESKPSKSNERDVFEEEISADLNQVDKATVEVEPDEPMVEVIADETTIQEKTDEKDVNDAQVTENLTVAGKINEQAQSIDDDRNVQGTEKDVFEETNSSDFNKAVKVDKQVEPDEPLVEVIADETSIQETKELITDEKVVVAAQVAEDLTETVKASEQVEPRSLFAVIGDDESLQGTKAVEQNTEKSLEAVISSQLKSKGEEISKNKNIEQQDAPEGSLVEVCEKRLTGEPEKFVEPIIKDDVSDRTSDHEAVDQNTAFENEPLTDVTAVKESKEVNVREDGNQDEQQQPFEEVEDNMNNSVTDMLEKEPEKLLEEEGDLQKNSKVIEEEPKSTEDTVDLTVEEEEAVVETKATDASKKETQEKVITTKFSEKSSVLQALEKVISTAEDTEKLGGEEMQNIVSEPTSEAIKESELVAEAAKIITTSSEETSAQQLKDDVSAADAKALEEEPKNLEQVKELDEACETGDQTKKSADEIKTDTETETQAPPEVKEAEKQNELPEEKHEKEHDGKVAGEESKRLVTKESKSSEQENYDRKQAEALDEESNETHKELIEANQGSQAQKEDLVENIYTAVTGERKAPKNEDLSNVSRKSAEDEQYSTEVPHKPRSEETKTPPTIEESQTSTRSLNDEKPQQPTKIEETIATASVETPTSKSTESDEFHVEEAPSKSAAAKQQTKASTTLKVGNETKKSKVPDIEEEQKTVEETLEQKEENTKLEHAEEVKTAESASKEEPEKSSENQRGGLRRRAAAAAPKYDETSDTELDGHKQNRKRRGGSSQKGSPKKQNAQESTDATDNGVEQKAVTVAKRSRKKKLDFEEPQALEEEVVQTPAATDETATVPKKRVRKNAKQEETASAADDKEEVAVETKLSRRRLPKAQTESADEHLEANTVEVEQNKKSKRGRGAQKFEKAVEDNKETAEEKVKSEAEEEHVTSKTVKKTQTRRARTPKSKAESAPATTHEEDNVVAVKEETAKASKTTARKPRAGKRTADVVAAKVIEAKADTEPIAEAALVPTKRSRRLNSQIEKIDVVVSQEMLEKLPTIASEASSSSSNIKKSRGKNAKHTAEEQAFTSNVEHEVEQPPKIAAAESVVESNKDLKPIKPRVGGAARRGRKQDATKEEVVEATYTLETPEPTEEATHVTPVKPAATRGGRGGGRVGNKKQDIEITETKQNAETLTEAANNHEEVAGIELVATTKPRARIRNKRYETLDESVMELEASNNSTKPATKARAGAGRRAGGVKKPTNVAAETIEEEQSATTVTTESATIEEKKTKARAVGRRAKTTAEPIEETESVSTTAVAKRTGGKRAQTKKTEQTHTNDDINEEDDTESIPEVKAKATRKRATTVKKKHETESVDSAENTEEPVEKKPVRGRRGAAAHIEDSVATEPKNALNRSRHVHFNEASNTVAPIEDVEIEEFTKTTEKVASSTAAATAPPKRRRRN